jgi:flagellar hook-length control protein FliK
MKTSNVSPPSPSTNTAPVKSPTAPADGGATDFLALFTQVMESSTPVASGAVNMLAAGLSFGATTEQEKGGDLDESELAMMMAALAGAPVTPPMQANMNVGELGNSDLLQTSSLRGGELAGAMVDLLAAEPADVDAQDSGFDTALANADGNAAVDPRAAQGALDSLRDARQSEAPVQRQIHAPVGTRAWTEELGTQINWLTERGQHAASLRLSPEHLGPLEVRISIKDDQASVWFGAAHADTRAAIEDALPRLREMLAAQGLALNDAGVFKEAPRQQPQFQADRNADAAADANATEEVQSVRIARLGLVDAYA